MTDLRVGIGVDRRGGTHGSPTSPLLSADARLNRAWAPAGQSPAPPAIVRARITEGG
jgi:hypothetical protein